MLSFRERMDIADFDLKTYLVEKTKDGTIPADQRNYRLIAIAKHLCGGATDLALTSMSQQDNETTFGVSIATCCHHCCDSRTYVNMPYLRGYFTDEE